MATSGHAPGLRRCLGWHSGGFSANRGVCRPKSAIDCGTRCQPSSPKALWISYPSLKVLDSVTGRSHTGLPTSRNSFEKVPRMKQNIGRAVFGFALLVFSAVGYGAANTTNSSAASAGASGGSAAAQEAPKGSGTAGDAAARAKKPKKPKGEPPEPRCPSGTSPVGPMTTGDVVRPCTKNGQSGTKLCTVKSIKCMSETPSAPQSASTERCGECRIGGATAPATTSTSSGR